MKINKELNEYKRGLFKNLIKPIILNEGQRVWIFHHNDADGYASGFLSYKYITRTDTNLDVKSFACDYTTNFTKFDIASDDIVFLVDLSFTKETVSKLLHIDSMTKNIIWIDHHESDILMFKELEYMDEIVNKWLGCVIGGKENKWSAAMLVYCSLSGRSPNWAPLFIKLVSDWDTWTHKYYDYSLSFNKAVNVNDIYIKDNNGLYNNNCIWEKLFKEYDNEIPYLTDTMVNLVSKDDTISDNEIEIDVLLSELPILDRMIQDIKPIVDAENTERKRYLVSNSFEFNLFGHRILVCNRKDNSLLFGKSYNDYDIVCPFVCNRRNGEITYTYSLFSSNKNINCREIAELFGGGGHKGAAGFQLKSNIFTMSKRKLKFKLFMRKIFKIKF